MDRVRFGRALGAGAREAARAVMKAADAAAAPNPTPSAPRPAPSPPVAMKAAVVQRVALAKVTTAGVKRGGRRFGEAMWGPLAKAGSVLWLEVTGVLFGMFAAAAGVAVWHDRANFRAGGAPMHHAWFALAMLAAFAYFTVSSYARAAKRGRR